MVAGLAQTLIITPVDLLKIRQQIQTSLPGTAGYVGPLQLLLQVVRREGVAGRFFLHPHICQTAVDHRLARSCHPARQRGEYVVRHGQGLGQSCLSSEALHNS